LNNNNKFTVLKEAIFLILLLTNFYVGATLAKIGSHFWVATPAVSKLVNSPIIFSFTKKTADNNYLSPGF